MTERETGLLGRHGRFVWGGAAALLLLVLVASLVLSGSSVSSAEQEAQEHAENLSAAAVDQLTLDLLTRDIDGTDDLALTVRVQAGILSDDRFSVVRIWRIDGSLIYSTDGRDDVNGVSAGDDPWIRRAVDGRTVSVLSSEGTYHEGLRRPSEELFQTFIPIRLSGEDVVGVVQIDQRYGAIHDEAFRVLRPLQVVGLLLLIVVGVMLIRSLRGAVVYGAGGVERRTRPGRRADDVSVRDAAHRADRAERGLRQTAKRVAELESQLARAQSAATATAAMEELDLRLRASEAEREELGGTVKRLRSELAEKVAEVALARDGSAGTRPETKRVNKLIADAEGKAVAAERKAAAAEKKSHEAAKRASLTAERGLEMEAQLREAQELAADAHRLRASAEQRVADAERRAAAAENRAADAEIRAVGAGKGSAKRNASGDRKVAAALRRAERERDQLRTKLEELDRELVEARSRAEMPQRELAVKMHPLSAPATPSAMALEERAPEVEPADPKERFADARNGFAGDEVGLVEAFAVAAVPADTWPDAISDEALHESAEGLSLRERLSRAANARKRLS